MDGRDGFGVPVRLFGCVPEVFYGLLGRVVMLASLLELRLLDLATALAEVPQAEFSGRSGNQLIDECRKALERYREPFAAAVKQDLVRVGEALEQRHAIVHSLWPAPSSDQATGWRPVLPRRRQSADASPLLAFQTSETALSDLVVTLVKLSERLSVLTQVTPTERRPH